MYTRERCSCCPLPHVRRDCKSRAGVHGKAGIFRKAGIHFGKSALDKRAPLRTFHLARMQTPAAETCGGVRMAVVRRQAHCPCAGSFGAGCHRQRTQPSGEANCAHDPIAPMSVFLTSTSPFAFLISLSFAPMSSTSM